MGKEVLYETFFTKAPGQEKLRKTAQGRVRQLLSQGWHEMAREPTGPDAYRIRFEREGATRPLPPLRTKPEPPPKRMGRGGPGGRFGGPGGRGGPPGGRGGPPGGRGGPPGGRGGPPGGRGGPPGGRGGPPGGGGRPPGGGQPPPGR